MASPRHQPALSRSDEIWLGRRCRLADQLDQPMIILRAIASGLLGRAAFHDGLPVSLPGLMLQWAMSLLIAAIFVVTARRMIWLRVCWIAAGLAHGVAVFVVMEFLVVPLSAAMKPHFTIALLLENVLAMLLFGLIVSFFARRLPGSAAR